MRTKYFFLPLVWVIAFLLRAPSLYEPNWYGDEGIYQTIGMAVSGGRLLYDGIWDNKPPLLYVIYGLFEGDQFLVRLSSLVVMLVTIMVFYSLATKLFRALQTVRIVTALFAILFAIPLLEGNIANAENFMLLPIIVALYIASQIEKKELLPYFFAGFLLGAAFLIKIIAIFDLGALLAYLFIIWFRKNWQKWFTESLVISVGFTLPILATFLYFFLNGALSDFVTAVFSQNVTYVGAGNTLFIGQGLLLLKLFLLSLFCLFIFLQRKNLTKEYIFIYLWLAFSIFNAFFGGRPWIHYLLTLLPAFCLFIGVIIENRKRRLVNLALCAILLLLIYKNFWIYGKTLSYYGNFLSFVTGSKTAREYLDFFDWYVTRDYEIASYIKENSKPKDSIFIWGDNAQIYALSERLPAGRYTVAYHVTFYKTAFEETKEAIEQERPVFIVAIRDDFPHMLLGSEYVLKREIKGAKLYERGI